MSATPIIRRMIPDDLDQVLEIQGQLQFQSWKREHFISEINEAFFGVPLVAQFDIIVGYAVLKIAADEAELCSIAVCSKYQGQGIARQLLDIASERLVEHQVSKIFLEVRKGNLRAQKLYLDYGFIENGVRRRYYPDGEDAVVMVKDLGCLERC